MVDDVNEADTDRGSCDEERHAALAICKLRMPKGLCLRHELNAYQMSLLPLHFAPHLAHLAFSLNPLGRAQSEATSSGSPRYQALHLQLNVHKGSFHFLSFHFLSFPFLSFPFLSFPFLSFRRK